MRKFSKIVASAAVTTLMFGAAVAAAAPASADSSCAAGYACAWQHKDYQGKEIYFQNGIANFANVGSGFNNMASSLKNSGNESNARWYLNTNYGGDSYLLKRGWVWSNLQGTKWQDALSSAKFV